MGFRESLQEDIENTFFSTDEFAEACSWNKKNIIAIVDDDSLIRKYSSEFEALGQGAHLVYVSENQFDIRPNLNDAVVFNNNLYTINEIKNEKGMLSIFLESGRG
jgi:hypothetical protein